MESDIEFEEANPPPSYWIECRYCGETHEFGEDDPTGRVITCDNCGVEFIANQ